MAQKRMLNKKISTSEDVSNLSLLGIILFTWMIPHADDAGLLPFSPKVIKALVIPLIDCSVEDVGIQMESMRKQGLIRNVVHNNKTYIQLTNFKKEQSLKKDRNPSTIIDFDYSDSIKQNWKQLETIGNQTEDNGIQMESEENRREGNRKEENRSEKKLEASPNFSNDGGDGHVSEILAKMKIPTASNTRVAHSFQETAIRYAEELGINLDELDKIKSKDGKNKGYRGRWFKIFKENKSKQLQNAYSALADDPKWETKSQEHRILLFFWIYNGNTIEKFESLQKSFK